MKETTDLEQAFIGTCENCKKTNVKVRRIKSEGSDFGGGDRGHFNICFVCIAPIIKFYSRRRKLWMYAPMRDYEPEKVTE